MSELPTRAALADALAAAAAAHHEFEQGALGGVRDELWAGFYAAFTLGRLGAFAPPSRLAAVLEAVDAPSEWAQAAADSVLAELVS